MQTVSSHGTAWMHRTTRINITDLNRHLLCVLCGGYLIDATTIIECLHSFCRTCIIRYLETSKYCPICDVQVHKTKPLLNIRSDKTLQDLVYKLVPGLFKQEMQQRREFYKKHPEAGPSSVNASEERGEITGDGYIYTEDEKISVCIQHCMRLPPYKNESSFSSKGKHKDKDKGCDRRYLLCPAAVTIGCIKKFIRLKFELTACYQIEVFHSDESLKDDYTLMDVSYIYGWRRIEPLKLYYFVFDYTNTSIKLPDPSQFSIHEKSKKSHSRKRKKSMPAQATVSSCAEALEDGGAQARADTNDSNDVTPNTNCTHTPTEEGQVSADATVNVVTIPSSSSIKSIQESVAISTTAITTSPSTEEGTPATTVATLPTASSCNAATVTAAPTISDSTSVNTTTAMTATKPAVVTQTTATTTKTVSQATPCVKNTTASGTSAAVSTATTTASVAATSAGTVDAKKIITVAEKTECEIPDCTIIESQPKESKAMEVENKCVTMDTNLERSKHVDEIVIVCDDDETIVEKKEEVKSKIPMNSEKCIGHKIDGSIATKFAVAADNSKPAPKSTLESAAPAPPMRMSEANNNHNHKGDKPCAIQMEIEYNPSPVTTVEGRILQTSIVPTSVNVNTLANMDSISGVTISKTNSVPVTVSAEVPVRIEQLSPVETTVVHNSVQPHSSGYVQPHTSVSKHSAVLLAKSTQPEIPQSTTQHDSALSGIKNVPPPITAKKNVLLGSRITNGNRKSPPSKTTPVLSPTKRNNPSAPKPITVAGGTPIGVQFKHGQMRVFQKKVSPPKTSSMVVPGVLPNPPLVSVPTFTAVAMGSLPLGNCASSLNNVASMATPIPTITGARHETILNCLRGSNLGPGLRNGPNGLSPPGYRECHAQAGILTGHPVQTSMGLFASPTGFIAPVSTALPRVLSPAGIAIPSNHFGTRFSNNNCNSSYMTVSHAPTAVTAATVTAAAAAATAATAVVRPPAPKKAKLLNGQSSQPDATKPSPKPRKIATKGAPPAHLHAPNGVIMMNSSAGPSTPNGVSPNVHAHGHTPLSTQQSPNRNPYDFVDEEEETPSNPLANGYDAPLELTTKKSRSRSSSSDVNQTSPTSERPLLRVPSLMKS